MPIELHFLRPWVLVLLPMVWLCWFLLKRLPSTDAWQQLLSPHLYRQLLAQQTSTPRRVWLPPLMLLLGIVAAAGPSWQKLPQPAFQLKRATVLVLDMSMSMRATDIKPNRVTQARFKALDFARGQLEGEMALLAFAGDAYVISPLTPDHNNISLLLPDLKPEIMPAQGSDFSGALKMADQLLQQAGYMHGDIVFFTDGFDSSQFTQIRDQLSGLHHRVSILAFGNSDGAPVQLENGELLKDARGSIVLPKVPLRQLQEIASLTGGVYAHSSFDDSDVQKLLALPELKLNDQAAQTQMQGDQWQDAGIYLCYLLLVLGIWYLRQPQLFVLPLFIFILPQPLQAQQIEEAIQPAAPAVAFGWKDLWHSKTEQAKQAYDAGDYATARQQFKDPLWQGNAAYRSGDYAAAAELFRQDNSAAGQFNLGNSLALQQDYQQALNAYQQAQTKQPELPGLKENIELVKKLLEQQQQQSKQDSQQNNEQSQNKDPQQKQQDQSEQKQQEQKDQSGEPEQSSQDPSQPQDDKQAEEAKADPAQQNKKQSQQQQEAQAQPDTAAEQQKAIKQAWPNANAEQSQQLENLLRKVQDEPSLLLKNKMLLEYQKRQQQAIPRGVEQEW